MYTSTFCILIILLQTGLSVNCEDRDLNPLSSNYDAVDENAENFEFGIIKIDRLTNSIVEEICKDLDKLIYIKEEDVITSCKEVLNGEDLYRVRRAAEEVEGSGHDEDLVETTTAKTTTDQKTSEKNTDKETTQKVTDPTTDRTTEKSSSSSVSIVPEEEQTATKSEQETSSVIASTVKVVPVTLEAEGATIVAIVPEESIQSEEEQTVQPEVPPLQVSEEKEAISAETFDKHDPEKDTEIVKGGKTLIDAPEKQETKVADSGDNEESSVQTKESTEPKKAGSKDTTILIFLFVAVVVVGVLAFGYNFIKKKRQQSADLERVERNSVKRSLQNLTKPEAGEAEKKPLIGAAKEVEMVDMKKQPEESKENGATEQVVKT